MESSGVIVVSLNWSGTFEKIIHFFLANLLLFYVVDGPEVNLIAQCDLSATILFGLVDSSLIAFGFAQ